jgi:hypothetical protein
MDIRPAVMRALPMVRHKVVSDDYLQGKVQAGLITFTAIHTAIFMDWALTNDVILKLRGEGASMLWDGGDIPGSWTLHDDIGRAVAGALRNVEKVRNKVCFVHSGILTQNQIMAWAREAYPDRAYATKSVDLDEIIKGAWVAYNGGDRSVQTIRAFALVGIKEGYGCFSDGVDNEVLGVPLRSEDELRRKVIEFIA